MDVFYFLIPIFLAVWGFCFWIFYLQAKEYKTCYHLGLNWAKLHKIPYYACLSKVAWEESFQLKEERLLKFCRTFSPLFLASSILGFILNRYFPPFLFVQVVLFFTGIANLVGTINKVDREFSGGCEELARPLTIFTSDITDWKDNGKVITEKSNDTHTNISEVNYKKQPVLLYIVILAGLAFSALHFGLVFGFSTSEPYLKSIEILKSNYEIMEYLGNDYKRSGMIKGEMRSRNGHTFARQSYTVRGSTGIGEIKYYAEKISGQWQFKSLEFYYPGEEAGVDLLGSN